MIVRTIFVAAAMLIAAPAAAQTLTLRGADGQVVEASAADLAALPRRSVTLNSHGEVKTYEGPLLLDVLKMATLVEQGAPRGASLAQAVVARAADGYAVVFGLAELDPNTRRDAVILADQAEDGALADGEGPFRIVAEGDLRPARSARQVTTLEIVRFPAETAPHQH